MKVNILYINGWASNPSVFNSLIKELSTVTKSGIVIDWFSERSLTNEGINNALLNFDENVPTILIGWSSACFPILEYLSTMDLSNSNIVGSVLIGASPRFVSANTPDYNFGWHAPIVLQMAENLLKNPTEVIDAFIKKSISQSDKKSDDCAKVYVEAFQDPQINSKQNTNLADGLKQLACVDARDHVQSIAVPICLITGSEDLICPSQSAQWLHAHLKESQLHLIENTGHAPHVFKTNECSDYIKQFLKGLNF